MITPVLAFCRTFAAGNTCYCLMTTNHDAALTYAEQYMNRLLDIEDRIGQDFERKIDQMVEQKLRRLVSVKESESNSEKGSEEENEK